MRKNSIQKLRERLAERSAIDPIIIGRPARGRGLFAPLQSNRCVLRLGALRDALDYAEQAGETEIADWMLNFPSPFPVHLAEQRIKNSWQFLQDGKAVSLVAIERTTGALVGGAALNNLKSLPEPELAYWVAKDRWRQGLGYEITQTILDYAFRVRGDARVRASVLHGNTASVQLLQKLGFNPDGVEFVMAEPYASTVGLKLEEVIQNHQNTGSGLVQMSLNRWMLTREDWDRGATD